MSKKKNPDETRFDTLEAIKRARSGQAEDAAAAPDPQASHAKPDKPKKFKNPDYLQTSVYLPRTMHKPLKVALAEDEQEFSDLVETLLAKWLESRKKNPATLKA